MNRSQQKILSQLASSPNDVASGLAQCVEALRLISSLPRTSPIMVEYSGAMGSMIKAFGREHLARVPFRVSLMFYSGPIHPFQCVASANSDNANTLEQTVVGLLKASLQLPDGLRVTSATFYREDGTVDPTKVLIDENSWKELVPYMHTLHTEDEGQVRSIFAMQALSSATPQTVVSSPSPSPALASPTRSLNSNANSFIPGKSKSSVMITTQDGARVNLQALRRGSLSPV